MKDTIEALIELQQVDDEIHGQQLQRDELAANLERLKAILVRMGEELDDKREKLAEATRFYDEKQEDLQADSDRLSRAKQKLTAVTRTKEYAAMQRELDTLRRKFGEDEQEIMRLAQAIEEYKASIAAQEAKLADLQGEVKREESASAQRLGELDSAIQAVASRKKEITVRLDDQLARRYSRVLRKREGKAVVHADGGKCSGCQIRLPPQTFIMVQRRETLEACPNCQRFLYVTDSTE
ncbi:MAG: hypothetical protein H6744_09155 [Deltaproteobacteria bacterium]|nr:hypothetical protein [Deltaproteobacteria bacterium]MCB9786847.1 hypothetical protein [Deltaproteobacteria bacterium]